MDYIGKIETFDVDCKIIIEELNRRLQMKNCSKILKYNNNIKKNISIKNNLVLNNKSKDIIYHLFKKYYYIFKYNK